MLRMLTIAYLTTRRDCRIEWFWLSLQREKIATPMETRVVIVDFHRNNRESDIVCAGDMAEGISIWTAPKPTPWQGPHRLTRQDWFAAANARNTALCLAQDGWITYVDDLSVLLPGWLASVKEAVSNNYIACGAYKKVKELEVDFIGNVTHAIEFPGGIDNRLSHVTDLTVASPCKGQWLYGCSCAMPVEALLSINGWPEDLCDGQGFEDCLTGIVLENAGYSLRYDPRMMTYESEELHHNEQAFRREDYGVSPEDKSHRALEIALASKHFPNSFGGGGIRELRQRVLAGEAFPVKRTPDREWFTGRHLADL